MPISAIARVTGVLVAPLILIMALSAVVAILYDEQSLLKRFSHSSDSPIQDGVFHAVSMATTTGFTTADFSIWPSAASVLLFLTTLDLLMLLARVDLATSFSAVAASINNLGHGLGDVALKYANVTATAKWLLILAMLLGSPKIFTLLVLFKPVFWRR